MVYNKRIAVFVLSIWTIFVLVIYSKNYRKWTNISPDTGTFFSLSLPNISKQFFNNSINLLPLATNTSIVNDTSKISITSKDQNTSALCPIIPPNLGNRIPINLNDTNDNELIALLKSLMIEPGGTWRPNTCVARHRVAIIVPYRNRPENLKTFIRHMHPFLRKQQLDYGIYIVEPLEELTFNRGLLMNIGYLEALKLNEPQWQCFMFHDVDL